MSFEQEVQEGQRFEFGKNWKSFHSVLDEAKIAEAKKSFYEFFGGEGDILKGKSFLDIGSGSGLFSFVARTLGAKVQSFDYDIQSVECTKKLKEKYFPEDPHWNIQQGSVLERQFIEKLGKFDVCYAWGVLHHTDSLWQALYNAHLAVAKNGFLFIGIYNDQGIISAIWEQVKRIYCSRKFGKGAMTALFYPLFFFVGLLIDIVHLQNPKKRYEDHKKNRGMSLVHDWKDWLGGFPYEPARPHRVIAFLENLGYELCHFKPTQHGFGNNQFLFKKVENAER